jgi:hypothetical protein
MHSNSVGMFTTAREVEKVNKRGNHPLVLKGILARSQSRLLAPLLAKAP